MKKIFDNSSIYFLNYIFKFSNTYAYSIETLDSNPDLHEISQMEDENLPLGARRSRRMKIRIYKSIILDSENIYRYKYF